MFMDIRLLTVRKLFKFFTAHKGSSVVESYNDLFCLYLSQLIYFSDAFILKGLKHVGFTRFEIVNYHGPKAVVAEINGVNYVVVKGLSGRNRGDWKIILNFLPRRFRDTKGHSGFVESSDRLIPHIHKFISDKSARVVLTGHSMGGAVVSLASLSVLNSKVVTFGMPRIVVSGLGFGNEDITHYRVTTDPVPKLPPFLYTRPGKQILLKKKFKFWRMFENHKLYVYSEFIAPIIEKVGFGLPI
jgi:hypothetical protein